MEWMCLPPFYRWGNRDGEKRLLHLSWQASSGRRSSWNWWSQVRALKKGCSLCTALKLCGFSPPACDSVVLNPSNSLHWVVSFAVKPKQHRVELGVSEIMCVGFWRDETIQNCMFCQILWLLQWCLPENVMVVMWKSQKAALADL